eukprot:366259-Chlamydomonas_euryale.AAC.11
MAPVVSPAPADPAPPYVRPLPMRPFANIRSHCVGSQCRGKAYKRHLTCQRRVVCTVRRLPLALNYNN